MHILNESFQMNDYMHDKQRQITFNEEICNICIFKWSIKTKS